MHLKNTHLSLFFLKAYNIKDGKENFGKETFSVTGLARTQ